MKVICISGKAQHGKDTTAQIIKEQLTSDSYSVLIVHYADLLKHICRLFFDWDGQKDERGRHVLQYVGTDIIRAKRPNFWVDFVVSILELFPDSWDYVLIPDCRFPNEVDGLIKSGFDVTHLRVNRPGFESPLTKEQQNHPSETALDNEPVDYYIENSGTVRDLYEVVADWIAQVNGFHQMTFDELTRQETTHGT